MEEAMLVARTLRKKLMIASILSDRQSKESDESITAKRNLVCTLEASFPTQTIDRVSTVTTTIAVAAAEEARIARVNIMTRQATQIARLRKIAIAIRVAAEAEVGAGGGGATAHQTGRNPSAARRSAA